MSWLDNARKQRGQKQKEADSELLLARRSTARIQGIADQHDPTIRRLLLEIGHFYYESIPGARIEVLVEEHFPDYPGSRDVFWGVTNTAVALDRSQIYWRNACPFWVRLVHWTDYKNNNREGCEFQMGEDESVAFPANKFSEARLKNGLSKFALNGMPLYYGNGD